MQPVRLTLIVTLLLTLAHGLLWRISHGPVTAVDVQIPDKAPIAGLAFNAYTRWQGPESDPAARKDSTSDRTAPNRQTDSHLQKDIAAVSQLTRHIRAYSMEEWPGLADLCQQTGLQLTLGVWLGEELQRNQRELNAAVQTAQQYNNIAAVIVGNETQLQNRIPAQTLMTALDTLRNTLDQPVSTAEPWHVWLDHPELADHVDFITVHLLPYWENIPLEHAVDHVFMRLRQVQQRFPDKRVVIGETGWPSGGPKRGEAIASPDAQAIFMRTFIQRAWQEHATAASPAVQLQAPPQRPSGSKVQVAPPLRPESNAYPQTLPDYFLMEAIDQPWKVSIEGTAGAYWGLLDADRHPKFSLTGPVDRDPFWIIKAALACSIGAALMCILLLRSGHLNWRAQTSVGVTVHALSAALSVLLTLPADHYLSAMALLMSGLMLVPSLLLLLVLIAQILEFADLYWSGQLRNEFSPKPWPAGRDAPVVSVHMVCSNEPASMVIASIQSLMALDWPALQIIIIDNNSRDASHWKPVSEYVLSLGAKPCLLESDRQSNQASAAVCINRAETQNPLTDDENIDFSLQLQAGHLHVIYQRIQKLDGFKAGALNRALSLTSEEAEWIAVVDADYRVRPDWIRSVGGWFEKSEIAVIQSPQAHEEQDEHAMARIMRAEYDGFFRIGMHHRNERNAIIQHGTMALIRAQTLRNLQGWDTDCICEDTELGLRILQTGAQAIYIDEVMGVGQLPRDSNSYFAQRYRWACGAMQIARKHAQRLFAGPGTSTNSHTHLNTNSVTENAANSSLINGDSHTVAQIQTQECQVPLSRGQRYHFIAGWLPWWGDAVHALLTLGALTWTLALLMRIPGIAAPPAEFMWPPLALLGMRLLIGPVLYRRRVSPQFSECVGCALAGMALSHSIARGILAGLLDKRTPFIVTKKSDATIPNAERPRTVSSLLQLLRGTQQECILLFALCSSVVALLARGPAISDDGTAWNAWILMLGLQGLPYAASVLMAVLSWHRLRQER